MLNFIKDHLYHVISLKQHGFCTGRSCVTNLLEALDHIGSLLDSGSQVDTIYLDMSKLSTKSVIGASSISLFRSVSMATCLTVSVPTCQADTNALRYSAPLQTIFLLPLEYLRVPYLDQPSSFYTSMTFPKSSVLAVEF